MKTAIVNKIINFSNVDGPHNRMAIFFQSCNLKCLFCHNPETINYCNHCAKCVDPCPSKALSVVNGKVVFDPLVCINCDNCIKICPFYASPKVVSYSAQALFEKVRELKDYIKGITVSGGECSLQADFLVDFFTLVKKLNLTTFMDTNGLYDFEKNQDLLAVTDKIMLDVKAYDPKFHNLLTKGSNKLILKNLEYLLSIDKIYEVRTIIFPNKDKENYKTVSKVASIIKDKCYYKLIKYRPYGVKEKHLDFLGYNTTDDAYFKRYVKVAKDFGASRIIEV